MTKALPIQPDVLDTLQKALALVPNSGPVTQLLTDAIAEIKQLRKTVAKLSH